MKNWTPLSLPMTSDLSPSSINIEILWNSFAQISKKLGGN